MIPSLLRVYQVRRSLAAYASEGGCDCGMYGCEEREDPTEVVLGESGAIPMLPGLASSPRGLRVGGTDTEIKYN